MSKGFGSGSSKKKRDVRQLYLDNQFAEGKKYHLLKNYSKAELIFLNLKDSGYENPNLFLYLANDDQEYIRIITKLYEQRELLKKT